MEDKSYAPELRAVLESITKCGVPVDLPHAAEKKAELEAERAKLTIEITEMCREQFDIDDGWQLGVVLFEKLGLSPVHRAESGYRVDDDHLKEIDHPVARHLLDYRATRTNLNWIETYLRAAEDGRVHPVFEIADIGRVFTNNPNVQSTPHAIRSIVVADPRYTFVKADWRAMHLRLLANLSLDPQLIGLFDCGLDPFVSLASMLFGHGAEEVTDSERSVAKASTYALLYGGTCHTIAQKNNLTLEAIKAYKDTFFQRFRGVDRWIERTVRNARNDGFITTVNGRQLSPMGHGEGQLKKGTTVNRILQGSEADILTEVIAKVAASFKQGGGVIAFPVHDEILTQARDGWVESTIDDLTYFMTEVGHDFVVPMAVKVMAGPNWGDLHEQPTSEWWKPCA